MPYAVSVTSLMPPGEHIIRANVEFPKGNKLPEKVFKAIIENPLWGKTPPDEDAEAFKAAYAGAKVAVFQEGFPVEALKIAKYDGTADNFIQGINPIADRSPDQHNFGGDPELGIGHYGPERRMLMRFDLAALPKLAKVKKALLKLQLQRGEALEPVAYPVLVPWQEGSHDIYTKQGRGKGDVTWSARAFPDTRWGLPGCGQPGVDRAAQGVPAVSREIKTPRDKAEKAWMCWDLTEPAAGWIAEPAKNHGVLLVNRGYGHGAFRSSEYEDPLFRPKLIVVWE